MENKAEGRGERCPDRSARGLLPCARGEVMVAWTNEVAVGEVISCQISGDILKVEQIGYPAGLMWGVRAREASG